MTNNLFTIEWVAPFFNIESLIKWEKEHNHTLNYLFYIVTGIPTNKQKIRSYCGISMNKAGYIYNRYLADKTHIVHYLRNEEIWIGKFSDNSPHTREDVELCETMIISYWQPELNIRKKAYYPNKSVTIINRWYKKDLQPREKNIYTAQTMPDLIIYDGSAIWGTEKIKKLKTL